MAVLMCDFLCLVSTFIIYGNCAIILINGLIVEEFLDDYQAGETITTWVASLQIALCLLGGFLAGALVELYGNRKVTIAGTLMTALGFILTAFTKHVGVLFLTYSVLTGVGLGLQNTPTLIVPQYVFTKRREMALGFIVTACGLGAFVLPVMFNSFREEYGYRGALLLWAGITLNSVPLGMVMTMHPQIAHLPVPPGTNQENDRYPVAEDENDVKRKNSDQTGTAAHSDEAQGENESTKQKIRVKFDDPIHDSDCSNRNEVNDLERDAPATLEMASRVFAELPEEHQQSNPTITTGVHCQQDNDAEKDIQKLPLPGSSLMGELRRAIIEMQQGILELRGGSCRMLIAVVFFFSCGYMMPYIFLPGKALQLGLSKTQASWLVAAIGMSETMWRLIAGIVAFMFKKHIVVFYGLAIIVCGGGCIGMLFVTSFNGFLAAAIVYGAGLGSYVAIYTLSAIAIIGLSKIVRMIGLISLAWGVAYLISPSLGAAVYEATGNVDVPFYMGSSLQLLAAVLLFSFRISPMYQTRPGALEENAEKDIEDGLFPPGEATFASSHRSLASLTSIPTLGTHLGVIWHGSGSWVGSTASHISCSTSMSPKFRSSKNGKSTTDGETG